MNRREKEKLGKGLIEAIDEELKRQGIYSRNNRGIAVAFLVEWFQGKGETSLDLCAWQPALRDIVSEIKAGL